LMPPNPKADTAARKDWPSLAGTQTQG